MRYMVGSGDWGDVHGILVWIKMWGIEGGVVEARGDARLGMKWKMGDIIL